MCLFKTHKRFKTAAKDITVYKVLTRYDKSPYQLTQYMHGYNHAESKPWKGGTGLLGPGYLHAYITSDAALRCVKMLTVPEVHNVIFKIEEMIIPAGTKYYEGLDDDICAPTLYWPE